MECVQLCMFLDILWTLDVPQLVDLTYYHPRAYRRSVTISCRNKDLLLVSLYKGCVFLGWKWVFTMRILGVLRQMNKVMKLAYALRPTLQRESDQRPNEVGLRFKKWNRTSPCLSPEETQHWREASSQSKVGLYCIIFFICFDLLPQVNFVSIMFLSRQSGGKVELQLNHEEKLLRLHFQDWSCVVTRPNWERTHQVRIAVAPLERMKRKMRMTKCLEARNSSTWRVCLEPNSSFF